MVCGVEEVENLAVRSDGFILSLTKYGLSQMDATLPRRSRAVFVDLGGTLSCPPSTRSCDASSRGRVRSAFSGGGLR